MNILLLIPIVLPIVAGIHILKRNYKEPKSREKFVSTAVIVNAIIVILLSLFARGTQLTLLPIIPNNPIQFKLDNLGAMFASVVSLLWILCIYYSFEYMKHEGDENRFFGFYVMTFGVMMGITFAANLVTLYLFYEFLTLATIPLVMHGDSIQAKTATRIYIIFSVFGAALALMGIAMIAFAGNGSTAFAAGGILPKVLTGATILQVAYLFTFFGFGVKSAVMPFHAWLPCASVAPTPVSALLHAVAVVKAGVFAIARVTYFTIGPDLLRGTIAQSVALGACIITIVYGSAMALMSQHLKRRLAYSTVSQLSYILFGIVLMSADGYIGGMVHLFGHAIVKITLFLCAGAIIYKTGREYVWELKGIGRAMPVTMIVFTIASFALVGIPPLPGFFSKWYLTVAAFHNQGNALGYAGLVALAVSALLTAIYLFSICVNAFMPGNGFDYEESNKGVRDPNRYMTIPLSILAVAIVLFALCLPSLINILSL